MPSLADSIVALDTSKYARVPGAASPTLARPQLDQAYPQSPNNMLRCPLPPVAVTPDSLRQFYSNGLPQMRTLTPNTLTNLAASPSGNTVAGTAVVVTGSSATPSSGGGSGGGSSSGAATAQIASLVTPALNPGQSFQIPLTMSRAFGVMRVVTSAQARVRMYATQAAQIADLGRTAGAPIQQGNENAIIADFLLMSGTELNWTCSPFVPGFNDDSPQAPLCYVTVTNPAASSNTITVSFTYVVLEA